MPTEADIWVALQEVKDPEIPTISLVDLGVITGVAILDDGTARVTMTPTFTGCPAINYMKADVRTCLLDLGFEKVDVDVNYDVQWNSNRVTDRGRLALREHGLAEPPRYEGVLELDVLNSVCCPNCNSARTTLRSPFGPTLCRALYYCNECHQAFEGFKPL